MHSGREALDWKAEDIVYHHPLNGKVPRLGYKKDADSERRTSGVSVQSIATAHHMAEARESDAKRPVWDQR
jgi:hypothetical protein